jgi:hypothetical protein
MSSTSQRFTRTLATALAAGAALAPAAAAQQDLRMPDTREFAEGLAGPRDLRMPDTRELAERLAGPRDLRMPDTRDAARAAADQRTAPVVEFVEVPAPAGFDWGDAIVGAGGAVGAVLIGTGGALVVARVRRRPHVRTAH